MGGDVSGPSAISSFDNQQGRREDRVDRENEISHVPQFKLPIWSDTINPTIGSDSINPTIGSARFTGGAFDENRSTNVNSSSSKKRNVGIFPEETVVEEGDCVVDMNCFVDPRDRVCRVCQLTCDGTSSYGDLIQLGCNCLNDLGTAHRCCAEAWFVKRGNTCCEICGVVAKNITGVADGIFMLEWNDMPHQNSREVSILHANQPFCTLVMASVILSFVLLWIFHVHQS